MVDWPRAVVLAGLLLAIFGAIASLFGLQLRWVFLSIFLGIFIAIVGIGVMEPKREIKLSKITFGQKLKPRKTGPYRQYGYR